VLSTNPRRWFFLSVSMALMGSVLPVLVASAAAQYQLVTLVANEQDLGHGIPTAPNSDGHLANAWGLTYGATSPFWVADEMTGYSTLYAADGTIQSLVVTVPLEPNDPLPPGSPTGIAANPTTGFVVSNGVNSGPARFIFATLDGTISGWNPAVDPTNAIIAVDNTASGPAAYTGLDILVSDSGTYLYAANAAANRIEVYDTDFNLVNTFTDPSIPPPFGVYGVSVLQGTVYVTYSTVSPGKPGDGVVDTFDPYGNPTTIVGIQPNGPLNLPWGMAIAPADFGGFSNALLVGNVQDGRINAFDPNTGAFLGALSDIYGNPIEIPGLWGIKFGGGAPNNGNTNELFLTAGPDTYRGGLFAKIVVAGGGAARSRRSGR
jgi:uncharacterized protein (TIGR03118 family)